MKTLHALLIAINDYPVKEHRLSGCLNDLQAIKEYITARRDSDAYQLNLLELKNEQATRQNIITAFEHFNAAQAGDVCLLFFSGHGSQMTAPPEFHEKEKDRLLETIVCYDSRINGGSDLADKELGYLIWKAIHPKKNHFTAIMDCCHSGGNTRANIQYRKTAPNTILRTVQQLLGYENFIKGSVLPDYSSEHIQMAAARSNQLAGELSINGKQQGVFTYALIEALIRSNSRISYSELIPQIAPKIYYYVHNQYPQLDAGEVNRNSVFLDGAIKPASQLYTVSYDRTTLKWKLGAGSLHGIIAPTNGSPVTVLIDGTTTATIKEVESSWSYIEGWDHPKKDNIFLATVTSMARPQLKIGFAGDFPEEIKAAIISEAGKRKNNYFTLVNKDEPSEYIIKASAPPYPPALLLIKKEDGPPVFKRVEGMDEKAILIFIEALSSVAMWNYVSGLNNPQSQISSEDLSVSLLRVEGKESADESAATKTEPGQRVMFNYINTGDKWLEPFFRIEVKNLTNKMFYVKALYMGNDFSINEIQVNDERFGYSQRPVQWGTPFIPLYNEKAYENGITEIHETIKLFISTQDFYLDNYEQEGLEFDHIREQNNRPVDKQSRSGGNSDWKTINLDIGIFRPLQTTGIPGSATV